MRCASTSNFQALVAYLSVVHHPCKSGDIGGNFGDQIVEIVVEGVYSYRTQGRRFCSMTSSLLRIRSGTSLTGGGRTLMGSL